MIWLFKGIWSYRSEIVIALKVLAALRRTAAEITQEYIRNTIKTRLKRSLAVVAFELFLLLFSLLLNSVDPSLPSRLLASFILWGVTLYNLGDLLFITIPEIYEVNRMLKSKMGYAAKYLFEISVINELMKFNIVFLFVCLALGISTRTLVGSYFSYFQPWKELWALARGF